MAVSDLTRRVAVAAVGIPVGVALIYVGGIPLAVVAALLALLGTLEVYGLARARGWEPFPWLGGPAAVLVVLSVEAVGTMEAWAPWGVALLVGLTLAALGAAVFWRGPEGAPLLAAGITVMGVAYAAVPLALVLLLRTFPGVEGRTMAWAGAYLAMLPLVVTWLGDSAAYFSGKHLGRRKLIPSVSPKKTVEGAIGGLLGSTLGALAFAALFLGPGSPTVLPLLWAGVLGLTIGVVAPVGDLAESVMKREAGVKDSGALLPGHGGVLDRFDGIYFTVPLTYAFLLLVLT